MTVTHNANPSRASVGFTARVADEVVNLRDARLTGFVLQRARHAVLDWLGVTIAGSVEEAAKVAQAVVMADPGSPSASILGTKQRASAGQAALANGVAAHVLDFDDTNRWTVGHPSAPIVSAAMALGQARQMSGKEVMVALVAGMQGQARVALASGGSSYAKGFHTTGTFGTFGSAAACGRLLGLDAARMQMAFGLAATQAAGLRISFGTMGKHLNVAKAGVNGMLSAQLAAAGFTGADDGVEGRQGFDWTHGTSFDPARPYEVMGERLAVESVIFKAHACCHGTHSAIEGVKRLSLLHGLNAADVSRVQLMVSEDLLDLCGIPEPRTGLEGKFSIRHAATLPLAGMSTGPASFTDDMVHDPALVELRERIEVVIDDKRTIAGPTMVRMTLHGGETVCAEVDGYAVTSDAALAQQWETLVEKFCLLTIPVIGGLASQRLLSSVEQLEKLHNVAELLADATAF